MTPILRLINRTGLVTQICIGLVAGIALALLAPPWPATWGSSARSSSAP